jgi:HlyD family secretion protein
VSTIDWSTLRMQISAVSMAAEVGAVAVPTSANAAQPTPPNANPKSAPDKPAKRWPWRRIVIGVVLAFMILAWLLRNLVLGTPVLTYPVVAGNLRQTVVASGRIITPERVAIAAQIPGRVMRVAVIEGAQVVRDQLLIELDDADAKTNVAQAAAALAQANARQAGVSQLELGAAEQSLREAEANVRQAASQLARNENLKARGFIGQAALDEAQRNFAVAQSQRGAARLQVLARRDGGSQTELANAGVAQAQAALAQALVKLAQQRILAPAAGILISRAVEPGDVVQPGQVLMGLASAGKTQIEVQLDEKNLAKLSVGQSALASADAYANERFAASVSFINPAVDATRGAVVIKLDVAAPPPYLRQDMTVSVDIATAQRNNVLVIPIGAVRGIDSTAPWVLVLRGKRAVRQPIVLGLLGDENAEVHSGLRVGDPVIPASAQVVEGAHVRMRPSAVEAGAVKGGSFKTGDEAKAAGSP